VIFERGNLYFVHNDNWELITDHFGGYAKVNPVLIQFNNAAENKIPLDPIYG
jgi:1-aminocyclopropane-1-carboxylate deaminase/D-cysteine desulfhydrase-like pyridoxal-dependent ACC family enzyme